jgi:putative transposase
MREPFTKLYVHLVWATWDRLPILSPEVIAVVEKSIQQECADMGVEVIAFGAVADHVHILVRFPTTLSIADMVKQMKGSSSHLLNQRLKIPLKWQGGYGAFTVSASVLPRVRDYVLNQEKPHQYGTIFPGAELQPIPEQPRPPPTMSRSPIPSVTT